MPFDPFRSARLIYRTIEDSPEDDAFVHSIQLDPEILTATTLHLLTPQSKAQTKKFADLLRSSMLAVMICLPPTPSASGHDSVSGGGGDGGSSVMKHGEVKGHVADGPPAAAAAVPIGFLLLNQPRFNGSHHRRTSISLSIRREHQNRGYGSEAIRWALGYAFEMAGLHRVGIEAYGYNERAISLYEKLGFVPEGSRREDIWYRGKWYDHVQFGMLEGEWHEMEKNRIEQAPGGKLWVDDPTASVKC